MVATLDLSNNQVFISQHLSLFHKCSTNKRVSSQIGRLVSLHYYVNNGIKMHFWYSSVFDSQDSQEGSDKMKDIVFCSNNCFVLYSAAVQAKNSENKVSIKHWQTRVS